MYASEYSSPTHPLNKTGIAGDNWAVRSISSQMIISKITTEEKRWRIIQTTNNYRQLK